jgi:hypothetical protein
MRPPPSAPGPGRVSGPAVLGCAALALALAPGCGSDRARAQARYARRLTPAQIQRPAAAPALAELRTLAIRVYADEAYQAQNLRWERGVAQLVERANQVLTPTFGIALRIEATAPWRRQASDTDLTGMLAELEALDPGREAAWVVGFVTALPQVSSSLALLGFARPLGRHMIMRGMNDTAERKLLDDVLDDIEDARREALYQQRKAHKELAVFLHEWAHTLGAIHTTAPGELMNTTYDGGAQAFAAQNARIIALGLGYRGRGGDAGQEAARWNTALRELLADLPWDRWVQADYQQLLAVVDQGPHAAPEVEVSTRLTPASRRVFYAARDRANAGDYEQAFRDVLPLTESYDDEPQVMVLGCRVSARAKGARYPTPELCGRAATLAPDDATPLLELAAARFGAGETAAGLAALRDAHARLAAAGDAAAPAQWLALAQRYRELDRVTWVEEAATAAGDADGAAALRAWAGQTRRRYGLAPGAVPPDSEDVYVAGVKEALALVYASQWDSARAKAAAIERQFPRAAGPAIALCDLELRRGHETPARAMCRRALERYDEAVWAMYLLASIHARARAWAPAIRQLERAIAIEPSMQAAWRLLARAYAGAGKTAALDQLRAAFEAQFGAPLP